MVKRSTKILYVDDDAANRALVRKLLSSVGYEVTEAVDGINGIDLAQQNPPDLILMDMNMPGLDGYEATTRIKNIEALKETPIVSITANILAGDRERSLIAGCDGYISKPIDPDTFTDEVTGYLNGTREKVEENHENSLLRQYNEKLVMRLENKVRALRASLFKEEQLSHTKSHFLYMISHELRTPLSAIINAPELFRQELGNVLSEHQLEWLEVISNNGRQLLALINNIILFTELESRKLSIQPSPVTIHDLVTSAINRFQSTANIKGIVLNFQCPADLPFIFADITQISRVVPILLDNAIKFTNEGNVNIQCSALAGNDTSILENARQHLDPQLTYAVVCVKDSGIGIEEGQIEQLFNEFSQLDEGCSRRYNGVGLSLAIAYRLVVLHEGYLWAENNTVAGAKFCFALPIQPNTANL